MVSGGLDKTETQIFRAFTGATFGRTGFTGRAIDYMGELIRVPGRALIAGDEFFRTINTRGQIRALAYRQAVSEGLEGEGLARRMAELIQEPTEDMITSARDFAFYNTFTNSLLNRLGGPPSDSSKRPATRRRFVSWFRLSVHRSIFSGLPPSAHRWLLPRPIFARRCGPLAQKGRLHAASSPSAHS